MRFCGAYHGWWGDVQPGVGNPSPARETYTLKDMDDDTLRVLRTAARHRLRAGQPAAGAAPERQRRQRLDAGRQRARGRASIAQRYTDWLEQLRAVCTERGIVLIFDEVFVGFRLAPGGAQEYFGVKADMVTYGKTLGGGLPIGALCGRNELDEALPRRPPRRHLLRARHVQLAPLRHGGDARVPAAASRRRRFAVSTATSTGSGTIARSG